MVRRSRIDPEMIARLANAFFQAPPASMAARAGPCRRAGGDAKLPDAPAPSVVTTVAPLRPGAHALWPAGRPANNHSRLSCRRRITPRRRPRRARNLQRGLSAYRTRLNPGRPWEAQSASAARGEIDYSAIPRLLAADCPGSLRPYRGALTQASRAGAVPGGAAAAYNNNLYFLDDRAPATQVPSSSAPSLLLNAAYRSCASDAD